MTRAPTMILLVGSLPERELGEFDLPGNRQSVALSFEEHSERPRVQRARDLGDSVLLLSDPEQPPCELVVLCERRPGAWSDAELARLRQIAPLARYVRVSGSWCEGQARSGHPASGTWAVAWHQWPAPIARELAAMDQGRPAQWSLPLTATPDERALAKFQPGPSLGKSRLIICSASAAGSRALADACDKAGYTTSLTTEWEVAERPEATALIWDTTPDSLRNQAQVARLRARHGDTPIIALVNFPRAEDVAVAQGIGVSAVLAKPLDSDDLFWHVDRLAAVPTD